MSEGFDRLTVKFPPVAVAPVPPPEGRYVVIAWGDINGNDTDSLSRVYGPFSTVRAANDFRNGWLKNYTSTIETLEHVPES